MDESCGPNECACPKSILNLLTPTECEFAKKWRERCYEYHASKSKSPNNLPVGTKIKCKIGGEEVILTKHPPAYQFKTPFWWCQQKGYYVRKKNLPNCYEVIGG